MRSHRTTSRRTASRPAHGKQGNGRRGFTLIELTIVVALIGILAGLAVYAYRTIINKARMTQAKTVLIHLRKMESIFYSESDKYTDNVIILDFDPVKYPNYEVSVVLDNNAKNFTGIATGVGPMAGDWWTITKDGVPVQADNSVFK
ncbi:MAG: fimbrial protein pilA [Deltaproteobacteria bacterium]|nr:fimbrial protein pilA [Deltaproteobacteria bacterium]